LPGGFLRTGSASSATSSNSSTLGSETLSSNASKALIRSIDAVGVKSNGLFVHAVSMAGYRWNCKRVCAPCQASHAIEKISHGFFVRFVGSETIGKACRNLPRARLSSWKLTPLRKDVSSVWVVCFVIHHGYTIAQVEAKVKR